MRLVVSGIAALTVSIASLSLATAESCGDRARTCVEKWGNPKAACYEPSGSPPAKKPDATWLPMEMSGRPFASVKQGRTDAIHERQCVG
jgi:hypothetical protein